MQRSFHAIVIGAGAIGLACAAQLARAGSVLVLERHPRVALENSSRNSGVIHAGVHHPASFLKTRLCVRGRELLYRRCADEGIPHRRTGKLILALSPQDEESLWGIAQRAEANGIECRTLDAAAVRLAEPAIRAHAALEIPCTGIVRSQSLVGSLLRECESLGVAILTGTEVTAIEESGDAVEVLAGDARFVAPRVVIAAGVASDRLAMLAGLDVDALGVRQRFVRGTWLALDERHRKAISRLVYPLPDADGLGIHLTGDLDGFLLAGPDTEPVDACDFVLPAGKEEMFAEAIGRYFPGVLASELHPLSVGIRPKLGAAGEAPRDFALLGQQEHGRPGLFVLAGIESPGLTACLAIGEEVAARLAVYP